MVLEPTFFDRLALKVGKEILGMFLVRVVNGREVAALVTEVEVYDGFEDRASHAFRGKTPRNAVMFGDAGYIYVYFVYGLYWMLNVVVGKKDYPAAILIRGAGDWHGPGKLTKELKIDKSLNGKLATPASGLWFEDRGFWKKEKAKTKRSWRIKTLPRVGIHYAGAWAEKPYRFILESSGRSAAIKKGK